MPHDSSESAPAAGHNGPDADLAHLHSHLREGAATDELRALAAQFVDGFRQAADKAAYLRLAGVPLEIPSVTGGATLKLVDLSLETRWQIGAASPAFGSAELSYLPFPGAMIQERVTCALTYVSLTERRDVDLVEYLQDAHAIR